MQEKGGREFTLLYNRKMQELPNKGRPLSLSFNNRGAFQPIFWLPNDLVKLILSFLHLNDVSGFLSTCRAANRLPGKELIWQSRLNQYNLLHPNAPILDSVYPKTDLEYRLKYTELISMLFSSAGLRSMEKKLIVGIIPLPDTRQKYAAADINTADEGIFVKRWWPSWMKYESYDIRFWNSFMIFALKCIGFESYMKEEGMEYEYNKTDEIRHIKSKGKQPMELRVYYYKLLKTYLQDRLKVDVSLPEHKPFTRKFITTGLHSFEKI